MYQMLSGSGKMRGFRASKTFKPQQTLNSKAQIIWHRRKDVGLFTTLRAKRKNLRWQ